MSMNAGDVIHSISEAARGLCSFLVGGKGREEGARYLRRHELRRLLRA